MKTWYEKFYGEPPPVNNKKIMIDPIIERLAREVKKQKNDAWEKAKVDYIKYLRSK